MADFIAKVAKGIATKGLVLIKQLADVIAMMADGITTKGLFYFSLRSEVLNRTSSHMCGRWYLPMFLLRDGLLTLMYNASLNLIGTIKEEEACDVTGSSKVDICESCWIWLGRSFM